MVTAVTEQASLSDREKLTLLKSSVGNHARSRPLNPIETAEVVQGLSSSMPLAKIAQELGLKDASILKQLLSVLKLPDSQKKRVAWGSSRGLISFSVAAELCRINDTDVLIRAFDIAASKKLSKLSVKKAFREAKSSSISILDVLARS